MPTSPPVTASRSRGAAHSFLRDVTSSSHDALDQMFSGFDLHKQSDYRSFLSAHARVLPVVEQALSPELQLEDWSGRTHLLLSDLALLGNTMPPTVPFTLPAGNGTRWGALYALEGSRLGGAVLAGRVAPGLPTAYLSAVHGPGAWKAFLTKLEGAAGGPDWLVNAAAGANAVFNAYRDAAVEECKA